ncbi:MAG: TAXI family TRAP transporter solute-binding subunit [Bradyrhizobium sp.]|uniref:TAXI family TRAP transporter solute-binding subunit n=1 Tax=Bradyrhizobium sp. TaxID=376 RepID=UPI001D3A86FC|nr:TAXI family TRAP transporter solute-binding subunit [Bradyrhizobium sp.]MBV9559824.1 TAXI family TRAP transporter solute-binding subunit [Bradyrhizobium sp.]
MSSSDASSNAETALPRAPGRRRSPFFLLLAAGLLFFAAAVGASYYLLRPTTLRIAVGPSGSDDQQVIQALAQTFAHDQSWVKLSVVPTAGAMESIAALGGGKADLAVARSDEDVPDSVGSIAILRKNVVVLWAPTGAARRTPHKGGRSKVKAISDLPGHRIGVIGRTEANIKLLRVILKESGVDPDKVQVAQFAPSQVDDMMRDANLDAFMTVGPIDSKITSEAIVTTARQRGELSFLPIDVSEAIAARHPLYESEEIPGSAFTSSPARPDDTVETVGVNHLIVARKSISETTIADLTRQIFAAKPRLAREVPGAAKIEKPDTDKDAAITAHPGAAAYIDGTERTFLDKYSDYFWGAILLFSVLGSVIAAVRHFLKRDERQMNTQHRERLAAAITEVRNIDSIEELDELLRQADEILRETLVCYDDGAIEDTDLVAYGLVLSQFHHAVTDRRAALSGAPVNVSRMRAS